MFDRFHLVGKTLRGQPEYDVNIEALRRAVIEHNASKAAEKKAKMTESRPLQPWEQKSYQQNRG